MYKIIKKNKKQKKIDRIIEKKKTCQKRKIVIYYLSVRNYKKLIEKLSCEIFYYDARNKKNILKKFMNEKQWIIVTTNTFKIKINVANIRVIVHANELKEILNYIQKNKQIKWNEKKNEIIVI